MNKVSILKAYIAKMLFARFVALSAAMLATTIVVMQPVQASAETRSLKLYFVHTGERAEIAFKRNGRFLPDGLKKLNVFLRDWRRNEPTKMDPRLFDLIWQVYRSTGSREYIHVVSAYRSPATNAMLRSRTRGVAKKSQHMLGHAMDYYIPGVSLAKLRATGMRYQIGGVGYYPRSGSPFVHMDVGNVRSWPRMSRRELLALFPDGKTAHLPADGQPLPGYQAALAMIEKNKSSGGSVMMASNSPRRKSKTLFGALFGGGADEEEDNSDSETAPAPARAVARPARNTPPPVAPVEEPEVAPPAPATETMIAALPNRNAPTPLAAPRPDAGLAEAEALTNESVAVNVPIPSRKPNMPAPAPDTLEAQALEATQVADAGEANPMLNGFVPIPSTRPDQAANQALIASVIPGQRPARPGEEPQTGQDAIAAIVSNDADQPAIAAEETNPSQQNVASVPVPQQPTTRNTELAMLPTKKDAIGELIGPPEEDDFDTAPVAQQEQKPLVPTRVAAKSQPASAPQQARQVATVSTNSKPTGVRTTAKSGRYVSKTSSKPIAVVKPAALPDSQLAMSNEPVSNKVPVTNPVLRNDAMRTAPTMVYTTGFQQGEMPADRASKFQGKAVTFMSVAKFSETN